jgi:hypothetical protein
MTARRRRSRAVRRHPVEQLDHGRGPDDQRAALCRVSSAISRSSVVACAPAAALIKTCIAWVVRRLGRLKCYNRPVLALTCHFAWSLYVRSLQNCSRHLHNSGTLVAQCTLALGHSRRTAVQRPQCSSAIPSEGSRPYRRPPPPARIPPLAPALNGPAKHGSRAGHRSRADRGREPEEFTPVPILASSLDTTFASSSGKSTTLSCSLGSERATTATHIGSAHVQISQVFGGRLECIEQFANGNWALARRVPYLTDAQASSALPQSPPGSVLQNEGDLHGDALILSAFTGDHSQRNPIRDPHGHAPHGPPFLPFFLLAVRNRRIRRRRRQINLLIHFRATLGSVENRGIPPATSPVI